VSAEAILRWERSDRVASGLHKIQTVAALRVDDRVLDGVAADAPPNRFSKN